MSSPVISLPLRTGVGLGCGKVKAGVPGWEGCWCHGDCWGRRAGDRRRPMTNASDLPMLPFERPDRFVLSAVMRRLQADCPIARVRTRSGDEAWLVTGYDEVKALFTDPRLGR